MKTYFLLPQKYLILLKTAGKCLSQKYKEFYAIQPKTKGECVTISGMQVPVHPPNIVKPGAATGPEHPAEKRHGRFIRFRPNFVMNRHGNKKK